MTTAARQTFETGALDRLRTLRGDPAVEFRPDQLEAIRDLVIDRGRLLCVQRTGWGSRPFTSSPPRCCARPGPGPR